MLLISIFYVFYWSIKLLSVMLSWLKIEALSYDILCWIHDQLYVCTYACMYIVAIQRLVRVLPMCAPAGKCIIFDWLWRAYNCDQVINCTYLTTCILYSYLILWPTYCVLCTHCAHLRIHMYSYSNIDTILHACTCDIRTNHKVDLCTYTCAQYAQMYHWVLYMLMWLFMNNNTYIMTFGGIHNFKPLHYWASTNSIHLGEGVKWYVRIYAWEKIMLIYNIYIRMIWSQIF